MEKRLFFVLGDLFSNIVCGIAAALVCAWLLGGMPMIPAMLLGMVLGMLISMIMLFAILMRMFGAMEPMVQCMTTGMLAGMFASMRMPAIQTHGEAIELGAEVGIAVFFLTWLLNAFLSGQQNLENSTHD